MQSFRSLYFATETNISLQFTTIYWEKYMDMMKIWLAFLDSWTELLFINHKYKNRIKLQVQTQKEH